jgi:hypothetical protein
MDVAVPSILGQNLADRLRSSSLALVGLVGAAALAMVGLTLQHGVAPVSSGPIHEPARESGVAPARALGDPAPPRQVRVASGQAGEGAPAASPGPSAGSEAGSSAPIAEAPTTHPPDASVPRAEREADRGSGRRQAGKAPVEPSPAPPSAPSAPAEQPLAVPSSEPAQPVPIPPDAAPEAVPGEGHAYGRGAGKGPEGAGPPGLARE